MPKVALVTDSTTYMPAELVKKYNISIAPQVLIWGDQTYKDGVDIDAHEFFTRLKTTKVMPTTSQVSVVSFQDVFQDLVSKGFDVLALLISSKLSGTVQSALQAKELMDSAGEKIHIVDSQSVAMALGFQVLAVARALEQGASLKEAIALAEKSLEYTGVFFAVDTLEFLHRGGRIGGAQRFIGTMLNMKPILAIQDGRVEGIERIRTKAKAHDRVLELTLEKVNHRSPVRLATLHANAAEDAQALLSRAEQALNPVESIFTEVSPTVGTHAGPGTVGLAFMAGL
ncbi:MAG TPA: DegV family protein [Anaerolineales bacterium]|nr:DegV family protein [Anaerolineales bacterium]HLO33908.1 DegV family protein [Anaerolineales bacterium]